MAIGEYQIQDSGLQIQEVIDKVQSPDTTPTAGSQNLVTSGGVKAALDPKADKVSSPTAGNFAGLDSGGNLTDSGKKASDFATAAQGGKADTAYQKPGTGIPKTDLADGVQTSLGKADTAVQPARVEAIEDVIPSQASSSNQLADKAFVNSSVATGTATFRGTYNLVTDLGLTITATTEQIAAAIATKLAALSITPDNNDYVFVQIPTANDKPTEIARVDRYKYNGSAWGYEYSLNNSGFTAAQWATLNSGLVSGDKTKLDALPTNDQLTELLNGKVDKVSGKGLSTNDYTTNEKNKLGALPTNDQLTTALNAKADKDTDAVSGNLAEFDANGNPVDSGDKKEDYVKKGSWDSSLTAGLAENLIDTKGQGGEQIIARRTSCGEESISDDGSALFKKLLGKSLVWNQLTINGDHSNGTAGIDVLRDGETVSVSDGIATYTYTTPGYGFGRYLQEGSSVSGHKYYASAKVKTPVDKAVRFSGASETYSQDCRADKWEKMSAIIIGNGSRISVNAVCSAIFTSFQTRYEQLIDLTLMFGAGNEPSTVAEFEALFNKPYYAYNAGQIINNNVEAYETVGFNQWDEEWELGSLDNNGAPQDSSKQIRAKNFIPAFPSTSYYYNNLFGNHIQVAYYDANKNFIGWEPNTMNVPFLATTPHNCYFIRFRTNSTVTSYLPGQLCINLSWSGYRNGEYEPYWKRSLPLGLNSFRVTDGTDIITVQGLKSAGSVYDEIDLVRKKYIKRVGTVDLGTLGWIKRDEQKEGLFSTTSISNYAFHEGVTILCSNYLCRNNTTISNNYPDKSAWQFYQPNSVNRVTYVYDTGYSNLTASQFKAAMSGVMLNYELATPIEYDLVDEIQTASRVADFGVEIAVPCEEVDANGVPKTTPLRAVIKYNDDMTRTIVNLPKNYQSQESMDSLLAALGTAMGGTWSKTWDSTNGKWTYSFTANSQSE